MADPFRRPSEICSEIVDENVTALSLANANRGESARGHN